MANARAQADIIQDIEGLVEADQRSPETQQELARERQGLVESLGEIKTLKARQQELTALRQEATQLLNAAFRRGKDATIIYRSAAKAKFGPRNERLVHFKVAPLRKRPRRALVVKPPDGGASGTLPDANASPSAKPVA